MNAKGDQFLTQFQAVANLTAPIAKSVVFLTFVYLLVVTIAQSIGH